MSLRNFSRRVAGAAKFIAVVVVTALIGIVFIGTLLADIYGYPVYTLEKMVMYPIDNGQSI